MTAGLKFPAETINRLSEHVLQGDVVFFIGAGFSVDSEGNKASRLVTRLLMRLQAFAEQLDQSLGKKNGPGHAMLQSLQETFDLKAGGQGKFSYTMADVSQLAARYYETNDWFCGAFGHLLFNARSELTARELAKLLRAIQRREEELRLDGWQASGETDRNKAHPALPEKPKILDDVPLKPFARALFARAADPVDQARRFAGKALFLDTMGFRDSEIMAGDPHQPGLHEIEASYDGRLLPRHHVLARLAREGFCTTTLTTNYDLLLEGAFRLAGFLEKNMTSPFPTTTFSKYARIASPAEFFSEGKAHRTAVLVKMHGCADVYRRASADDGASLRGYLPSMVFTYREIQNWREDSWAADYLRTLLRTRTVVFGGYSLQDPVVHDTLRTVYEEMAHGRGTNTVKRRIKTASASAPAFFLTAVGDKKKDEFHGMEILRAASRAVGGERGQFGQHPNYVHLRYRSDGFPNLDDALRWLFHRVVRRRQQECLATDLGRVLTSLLGRPYPREELDSVREAFQQVVEKENKLAEHWHVNPACHRQHSLICAWSEWFHPGLLREFAAADLRRGADGAGASLARLCRSAWYYPFTQDAGWTCWGAVVEVALRRASRVLAGGSPAVLDPTDVQAAAALRPTLLFRAGNDHRACPRTVTIAFAGLDHAETVRPLNGHAAVRQVWRLDSTHAPWRRAEAKTVERRGEGKLRRQPFGGAAPLVPPADLIWQWATAPKNDQILQHWFYWLQENKT